jgi:hypothetical protein
MFDYHRFSGGEAFRIEIFEHDDRAPRVLDTLHGRLDQGNGVATMEWVRAPEAAEEDFGDDLQEGESGPLEYYFSVSVDGRRHEHLHSGPLWLTHEVNVVITDESGRVDERPLTVVLTDAAGRRMKAVSAAGLAKFIGVVVGAMQVEVEAADGVRPC